MDTSITNCTIIYPYVKTYEYVLCVTLCIHTHTMPANADKEF